MGNRSTSGGQCDTRDVRGEWTAVHCDCGGRRQVRRTERWEIRCLCFAGGSLTWMSGTSYQKYVQTSESFLYLEPVRGEFVCPRCGGTDTRRSHTRSGVF